VYCFCHPGTGTTGPFDSRLAEWVPPVGGALSRHTSTWEVHATGAHTQARPSGAPKQAAEAMPSSQGDARAADRARTEGGGGGLPWAVAACGGNLGVFGV
jgi:hypothetical protein